MAISPRFSADASHGTALFERTKSSGATLVVETETKLPGRA
jgi:hypothetical protein